LGAHDRTAWQAGISVEDATVDIERPNELLDYLRSHGHVLPGQIITSRLLEGGVSNRTVLVERVSADGKALDAWVLKQALERLRVAIEWHSSPLRIHREAAGMRALNQMLPRDSVPTLVFEDDEHHLLAMSAVSRPHTNWRDDLLAGHVEQNLAHQYGTLLGNIHAISHARKDPYATIFADRSFFESLRLEPYYRYTAVQCPQVSEIINRLCTDTLNHPLALVHGDFSPKNLLVKNGSLILLDHEVIHWGDPAFDVGFSLCHLLSKALHLPVHRADFMTAAQNSWQAYRKVFRNTLDNHYEDRCQRHLLACLLARVDGRSPLSYLSQSQRDHQRKAAVFFLKKYPIGMSALLTAYSAMLEQGAHAINH